MKSNIKVPQDDKPVIDRILKALNNAATAYITWHARPDGDALGGGLALYRLLKKLNIEAELVSPTKPAETFCFFRDLHLINTKPSGEKKDLLFVLDCSDKTRLENIKSITAMADTIINIDHHELNHAFGDINYIRKKASSVCEMILNIINHSGTELDNDIAVYIYTGIFTDTNRFQEQNTTPHSHLIAAELIQYYISPVEITSWIHGNKELNALKLLEKAIGSLKISPSGKIAYITIYPEMLDETQTRDENLEGIINYARNIRGVEVGILLRKIDGLDGVKVSFRSKGRVDVGKIADFFGGGGHHNAAGCLVKGGFSEVTEKIIARIEKETP